MLALYASRPDVRLRFEVIFFALFLWFILLSRNMYRDKYYHRPEYRHNRRPFRRMSVEAFGYQIARTYIKEESGEEGKQKGKF